MPCVVKFLRDNVFGLITKFSLGPWAGHDNCWGDTTQFAGDALCIDWLILAFAFCTIGTGPVHDSVVGACTACHVDFVNARMCGKISADFCPSVGELNVACLAKSRENLLKENSQVIVNRVHLEQAHLPLG